MSHDVEHWFNGLFAVERGRGQPIIFFHGGLADHRASIHAVGRLGDHHRLITPDLRGAGRSVDAGPLSWDRLADDVGALLEHLGLERAVIGGSSAGSGVALSFALRRPEACTALVLVAPVFSGADVGLDEAPRRALARMHEYGQRALREGIEALFPLFASLPDGIRERALAMVASFDPASVAATTGLLASGAQPIASLTELREITTPTLLVPGSDPEHPAELALRYAEQLPNARISDPSVELVDAITELVAALGTICEEPGLSA